MSWPDGEPRFVLGSVTGYALTGKGGLLTTWHVCDRAYCQRVVWQGKMKGSDYRRAEKAQEACRELNERYP